MSSELPNKAYFVGFKIKQNKKTVICNIDEAILVIHLNLELVSQWNFYDDGVKIFSSIYQPLEREKSDNGGVQSS